ncbi:hypothetical protein H6G77_30545 [Aulosira sp. FACHB-615]|nr:hypothetical protein [Nostoc linckia FACHB-104]MBD2303711.1 hypothetical protein [Nostoc sp. FACHB-190]MBD2491831.1 hypothetical protein [Aulosira sp. FACHB-615]
MKMNNTENKISKTKLFLLDLSNNTEANHELNYLLKNFCGTVIKSLSDINMNLQINKLFACGDISSLSNTCLNIYIIKELSFNYEMLNNPSLKMIKIGQVPIIISQAGVYYRQLFNDDTDYFNMIKTEHTFQELTESNKPGIALRKGIYLTEVTKEINSEYVEKERLYFRLLRCSSNFTGPTDNFRATDYKIMNAINHAAEDVFERKIKLNHVLAQVYENKSRDELTLKKSKAKIKAHSDKTKDMPKEALIAFCTFYDREGFQHLKPSIKDRYDWCNKNISGLAALHFKLKSTIIDTNLEKEFTVVLYPNSVFIIPLSTNRYYTHEVKPSILNSDKIPTRLGYVARCSNVEAVYFNNQTYIIENKDLIKLEAITESKQQDLKETYYEENCTEKMVDYGKVDFSMNLGDYQRPIY